MDQLRLPRIGRLYSHFIFFRRLVMVFCLASTLSASGQDLRLPEAVEMGIANYGNVVAKGKYALAANERTSEVARTYLPSVSMAAQQSYGTINGQFGPLFGLNGFAGSSGPYREEQSWNAAFGALYFVNVNWEVFSFGRRKRDIETATAQARELQEDYEQELFQHKVKISSAYLNLLASQRLLVSQQKNLSRAKIFHDNVSARVRNGLMPGVDSALARAEVSRARITLNQVKEQVKTQNNRLIEFMGGELQNYLADTTFITTVPKSMIQEIAEMVPSEEHPAKTFMQSRINTSEQLEGAARSRYFPSITALGVYQARASGVNPDYATDPTSFSSDYLDGINPSRQNYLIGLGFVWNLTNISVASKRLAAQELITEGLQEESRALDLEIETMDDAANARLLYALDTYKEAPKQVDAAQAAYRQRIALYENGLTTLTDVTTALYTLNRAETDRDIAFTNLWQALLMKAAATGDFDLFLNEFK